MKMTINYKGNLLTKEVNVFVKANGYIEGTVGTARVCWNKYTYPLPLVHFKNPASIKDDVKKLYLDIIRVFVDEYLFVLKGKSPLNFEESTQSAMSKAADDLSVTAPSKHTSGVALWMKEEHKVWTECFKKKGGSYFRRTRYNKDSRVLIEKYLPHCQSCPLRSQCEKPCAAPEANSLKETVQA